MDTTHNDDLMERVRKLLPLAEDPHAVRNLMTIYVNLVDDCAPDALALFNRVKKKLEVFVKTGKVPPEVNWTPGEDA